MSELRAPGRAAIAAAAFLVVSVPQVAGQSLGVSVPRPSQNQVDPLPPGFVERAEAVGLVHESIAGMDRMAASPMYGWCQSGIALGDLDGDGSLDVVAAGGAGTNRVFLNDGAGQFTDATASAGINAGEYDRAVALGDVDRDGDLDLFLGALDRGSGPSVGRSRLYRNDGNGVFEPITSLAGTVGSGHSAYAKFYDLDHDGWLDLYIGEFLGTFNHAYRNNGDGTFTDATDEWGLTIGGSTHVVAIGDVTRDGLPEVVVGQDWGVNNIVGLPNQAADGFFLGQPDGGFVDTAGGADLDDKAGIMGIGFADVDYDGDWDVYKTNTGPNFLWVNQGWPTSGVPFTEESTGFGIKAQFVEDQPSTSPSDAAVGWSPVFFNADMDPWLDVYVTNGHIPGGNPDIASTPLYQENFLFMGVGPAGGFGYTERAFAVGIGDHYDDRGAAVGDVDADGDVDVLVLSPGGRLRYFENRLDREGQTGVTVVAATSTSSPGGIGVEVKRRDLDGRPHLRMIGTDAPTASNHALETFLALGHEPAADLDVTYPSGLTMRYTGVPGDGVFVSNEPQLVSVSHEVVPALGLVPGGASTITVEVFAHDASGLALAGEGVKTLIDMPGVAATTPVEFLGANRFRRTFRTPAAPGEYRVEVSFDDFAVGVRPTVQVYGALDPATSRCTATPECVRAGSADPVVVEWTPRDARGVGLGSGHDVKAQLSGLPPVTPPVDLGDGRYRMVFDAPSDPGEHLLDVTFDGVPVPGVGAIEAGDVADAVATTVYAEIPNPLHQIDSQLLKLELRPRDAAGRRLGPGALVEVSWTLEPGSAPVVLRDDLAVAQADGDHLIVLEKPLSAVFVEDARGTYEIRVDGVLVASDTFVF